MQQQWPQMPDTDRDLVDAKRSIDNSPLDQQHKDFAKLRVRQLLECRTNLEAYGANLQGTHSDNDELGKNYDWINAIVGAAGSASAPAVLAGPWALAFPGAAFLWEIFGLTTQKAQVQPKVDEGAKLVAEVERLRSSMKAARDAVRDLVLSPGGAQPSAEQTAAANSKFDLWNKQAEAVVDTLSGKGLCPAPVYLQ
jgi:hypothetical protein